MRQKNLKKRAGSLLLAAAMIITSVPVFNQEVQAAEGVQAEQPKITGFAEAGQLKDFNTNDNDGNTADGAKIIFGTDSRGLFSLYWWIVGSQTEDSVTLSADSELATEPFDKDYDAEDSGTYTKAYKEEWGCTYPSGAPAEVYANHYGGSSIRQTLKQLETSRFSEVEQALMKETTVYTYDAKNECVYSTTDKLYLPYRGESDDAKYITAGTAKSDMLYGALHIDQPYRAQSSAATWLRAPQTSGTGGNAGEMWVSSLYFSKVSTKQLVVPAFELDLSSVLFASAVRTDDSDPNGRISADSWVILRLRLDGSDKHIGIAAYDAAADEIVAKKDNEAAGNVYLVVQGDDGTGSDDSTWCYYEQVVSSHTAMVVTKEQIKQRINGLSSEGIDFTKCKIWLETTENGTFYAKMAETGEAGTPIGAGETVTLGDGTIITLPDGGKKGITGNVTAKTIIVENTTITAPDETVITARDDGTITVPAGGKVQTTGGQEITLPKDETVDNKGTVGKDGTVEAAKITVGNITVTAPSGEKAAADKAGNITVPAGGTVRTEDGNETTLPNGGIVDQSGTVTESPFAGSGTEEKPYLIQTEADLRKLAELVNSGKDLKEAHYKIKAEAGITLTESSRPWTPIGTADYPFTGTFDGDGKTIKGLDISGGEPKDNQGLFGVNAGTIEYLNVEGSVTGKDNVGGIAGTNAATGTIQYCTVDVNVTGKDNVGGIAGKNDGIIIGDTTNKGSITISAGGTVQTTSGKKLTLPNGGSVDKNGNVEAEKIISGETTVTAPDGEKVTADKFGNITVPAGGKVQTAGGKEITLPKDGAVDNNGTVGQDGTVEAGKITVGDITVTAPDGEKVTADKDGNITVPAGGKVQTAGGHTAKRRNC